MKALLDELFERYQKDVYVYLFSLCRDPSLAEELTADTFLAVVQSLPRFRGDSDEKTWLFSVARHRWYNYLRKKKKQPQAELFAEFLESGEPSPEDRTCDKETAGRILELLEKEPERNRNIVLLRLEGLSFCEIGQQCGISENSARVIDFRTKTKIRQQLRKEGYLGD